MTRRSKIEIETRVLPITEESMAEAIRILSAGGWLPFPPTPSMA
jgi:hypothetical protein